MRQKIENRRERKTSIVLKPYVAELLFGGIVMDPTVRDEGVADLGGENAFDKEIFDQDRCWVEHRTVRRVKIFLKRTVAWQTDVVGEEESLHAANWNTVEGEHLDVQRRLLRCFNTGAVKSE